MRGLRASGRSAEGHRFSRCKTVGDVAHLRLIGWQTQAHPTGPLRGVEDSASNIERTPAEPPLQRIKAAAGPAGCPFHGWQTPGPFGSRFPCGLLLLRGRLAPAERALDAQRRRTASSTAHRAGARASSRWRTRARSPRAAPQLGHGLVHSPVLNGQLNTQRGQQSHACPPSTVSNQINRWLPLTRCRAMAPCPQQIALAFRRARSSVSASRVRGPAAHGASQPQQAVMQVAPGGVP